MSQNGSGFEALEMNLRPKKIANDMKESTPQDDGYTNDKVYPPKEWVSVKEFTLICILVWSEVSKQVLVYSLQYFNHNSYPLPRTVMVTQSEMVKLIITLVRMRGNFPTLSLKSIVQSSTFVLPGVLYALNNNIYFEGLILVPPAVWLVLCSFRTAITALTYKFILKREVKQSQFMGVGCIIFSILVMKVPDLLANTNELPTKALALAIVASTISVAAAVYTEVLFKSGCNSKDASSASFLEKQFWLYFYGMVTAAFIHGATFSTYGMTEFIHDMKVTKPYLLIMYVLALAFDSVGGIVVATVLKVLDNVVKEYSASAANLGTAISCAVFFPKKFQFSTYVSLSFAILLLGIILYERGRN